MKWNEAQKQAIEIRGKNLLVSAAAGSGKTAVLVERIRRLIVEEGVDVSRMLIVTFTNGAASEMRERIYKAVSEAAEEGREKGLSEQRQGFLRRQLSQIPSANISTFHGFCLELIRRYFYLIDMSPVFGICDDIQKSVFQAAAMDRLIEEAFEWPWEEGFEAFAGRFAKAGNEREIRIMVEQTYDFIQGLPEPFAWLSENIERMKTSEDEWERRLYPDALVLEKLVKRYEQLYRLQKERRRVLDFGDIEHRALEILKDPGVCGECREQFRYIFIDEYQDSNVVQEALIDRIKRADNLFMVGDVKQSIYQFRLAEPGIFLEKYERCRTGQEPESLKLDLNRNFRSKRNVIECVNRVFSAVMTKETCGMDYDGNARLYQGLSDEKDIHWPCGLHFLDESASQEKAGADMEEMKREELEAAICASLVRELVGKAFYDTKQGVVRDFTYRDIVILMRSFKSSAQIYQETLQKAGVPAYAEGGDGYFDTVEIQVFINLLKIIDNRRQDIPLLSVLRSVIGGFTLEEIGKIRAYSSQGLFAEAFLDFCLGKAPEKEEDAAYFEKEEGLRQKGEAFLERLSRWRQLEKQMPLRDFLWHLAETSLYYEYVGALPGGPRRQANLRLLFERAASFQSGLAQGLFGYLQYLERMKETKSPMGEMKLLGEGDDVVRIMTIDKSKGLEFPAVILAGMGKRFNRSRPSAALSFDRKLGLGMRYRDPEGGFYSKTLRQRTIDEKKSKEDLAEEMRILYVAMTRARDRLLLVGSAKKSLSQALEKPTAPQKASCCLDWVLPPLSDFAQESPQMMEIRQWSRQEAAEALGHEEKREEAFAGDLQRGFQIHTPLGKAIQQRVFAQMDFSYPFQRAAQMPSKFTVSELNRLGRKEKASFPEREIPSLERDLLLPEEREKGSALTGAEKGTITHYILQQLSFSQFPEAEKGEAAVAEALREQIRKMVERKLLSEEEAKAANQAQLTRFLISGLGRRVVKAEKEGRLYKEQSFNLMGEAKKWLPEERLEIRQIEGNVSLKQTLDREEDERENQIMIQGTIDCFFREGEGYVLIDYKTDRIEGKDQGPEKKAAFLMEKKKQYEIQMGLYHNAVECSMGMPVKEAYLYFLDSGDAVKID